MIAALLLLLACGDGLPEQIEACPDEACRQSFVLDAYARDPKEGVDALERVADPVERVVIVTRIVETWPGRTRDLCSKLTLGPPRTRCERINGRPHLQTAPPVRSSTVRASGGPSSSSLPSPPAASSPYHDLQPTKGPCQSRREPHICYTTQAMREALENPRLAATSCAGIQEKKWASECMFNAAEMLVNARQAAGIEGANDLCIAAVPFSSNCLAHVTVMLARTAPDATERDPAVWAQTLPAADGILAYWKERSPEYAELFVDRYWSELMSLSYAGTPQVTGGPLDGLPEAAWPQVRAAAAYRLMELEGIARYPSLEAWTSAVEAALASRAETPHRAPPAPEHSPRRGQQPGTDVPSSGVALFQGKQNFWEDDEPGDEVWRSAFYWGTARRAVATDARTDIALCVLEAAAQHGSQAKKAGDRAAVESARTLLSEAARAPEPVVQWAATRLLKRALPE